MLKLLRSLIKWAIVVLLNPIGFTGEATDSLVINNVANAGACSTLCINNKCESTCDKKMDTDVIKGIGDVVSQAFVTPGLFEKVKLIGLNAVINHGETLSVSAVGQANILEKVQLEIVAGELLINLESNTYENAEVTIYIVLPKLSALTADGATTLVVQGFTEPEMAVSLAGSNKLISNQNTIIHLLVNIQGSNQIDWLDNDTQHLSVDMQGVNTMSVNLQKHSDSLIDGQLNGLNKISFCGEPTKEVLVNGLSSIERVDC